jgi:hypothetical protein
MAVSWCASTVIAHEKAIAKIPNEFPPQWFQERVSEIDTRLKEMTKKVEDNNAVLIRLQIGMDTLVKQSKP